MAKRVFLHIGLPKTGTTYVQGILRGNRSVLQKQGVLLPGGRGDHYRAYLDVKAMSNARLRARPERVRGTWKRLLAETERWPETALISNELFCGVASRRIAKIVADLQPAEVHVIVTVRDLARALPAAWQTSVKFGRRSDLSDYTRSVMDRTDATDWFQNVQFPEQVLARWSEHVPSERIHVVTVPPEGSPPQLLWHRFCDVLEVKPESFALNTTRHNESLGSVEAELLWRVNVHLVPRLGRRQVSVWIRDELANDILAGRDKRRRLTIPEDVHQWAVEHSRGTIGQLGQAGYDIRGDLEDLVPPARADRRDEPQPVDADEMLAAATETIAELVVRLRRSRRQTRNARERVRKLSGTGIYRGRGSVLRRLRRKARRLVRRVVPPEPRPGRD